MNSQNRIARAVLISAPLMLLPTCWFGAAGADVITANFVNDSLFSYRLDHMPDLDQKRAGLPGNGSYHCVPTSTMNLIMYAANHGFSDVQPGPGYWQAQQNYNTATGYIATLAGFMQTSYNPGDPNADPPVGPSGGTSGGNAVAGLEWYLAFQPDYFILNHHTTSPGYTTNFTNIAKSVIGGNIGTMSYGRYDIIGYVEGVPMVQRNGGHATTIVRAYCNGANKEIWVRDPADTNDSLNQQSPFTNRVIQVTDLAVALMDNNDPPGLIETRVMSALNFDPSATRLALIDGHRSIRPKAGYSFDSSVTQISLNTPNTFAGGNTPTQQNIPSPNGVIFQAEFSPLLQEFLVIAGDPNQQKLYRVDAFGNHQTVPLPATPKLMLACAPGHHIIVTDDGIIRLLSPTLEEIESRIVPADSFSLNFGAVKFQYPAAGTAGFSTSRIVLASTPARKVLFYPMDLSTPTIRDIPTFIPGNLRDMAIEPATGRVWLCMDQGNTLYGLLWNESGNLDVKFLNHAEIVAPTSVDFDDLGDIVVGSSGATGGHVKVFSGTDGGWALKKDSPFHNLATAGKFRMMRSSSNYDPAFHDHPRWSNNIDPDELDDLGPVVADCLGDVVADDAVNVSDLLALINAWGPCDACSADLDGNGNVNVSDLLTLLGNWGPCF